MLARALIGRPELIIFDEPTTALGSRNEDIFYSLSENLNRTNGTTIILVTHDIGTTYTTRHLLYLIKKSCSREHFEEFCKSREMTGFFWRGKPAHNLSPA